MLKLYFKPVKMSLKFSNFLFILLMFQQNTEKLSLRELSKKVGTFFSKI